jgi:ketopantoate reductase
MARRHLMLSLRTLVLKCVVGMQVAREDCGARFRETLEAACDVTQNCGEEIEEKMASDVRNSSSHAGKTRRRTWPCACQRRHTTVVHA